MKVDIESPSIKREKQESDVFGVWVELEMIKDGEEGRLEIGDEKVDEDDRMKTYSNNRKRVCEICQKEFSSGKALGGHMSSHVQLARDKKNAIQEISDFVEKKKKKFSCAICSKGFLTMKALSGHMRCHPERGWKGINPPSTISFSSSTSSLSDVIPTTCAASPPLASAAVDLMESLKGWSVTAKRGRKALRPEVDDAVTFLMMLARGERENLDEGFCSEAELVEVKAVEMDRENLNESQVEDDEDDEHYKCSSRLKLMMNGKKLMTKNKKKRKKVKLCDLDLMKSDGQINDIVFRCDTCDKSFPTHQALDGHRQSSHNIVFHEETKPKQASFQTSLTLSIDLNQLPI